MLSRSIIHLPRRFYHAPSLIHTVSTPDAPAAIGPYVQAVKYGNLVFISGCIPMDPKKNIIVEGAIESQTRQVLKNLAQVLKASNSSPDQVLKTTIFFTNITEHFDIVNNIYGQVFSTHKPARSAVEVSRLPKNVLIEIEAIAHSSTTSSP